MPKQAKPMSIRAAQAIKARGFHAVGGVAGLLLQVSPSGSKSWIFRYRFAGQRRWLGLGSFQAVSLADARELAAKARLQILSGVDPVAAAAERAGKVKAAAAKVITFAEAAERYVAAHEAGWNLKYRKAIRATLAAYAFPILGGLPVAAVDTALVMQVLEPLWKVKPDMAARLRHRLEGILSWAISRGYRSGDNPARWRGHLENLLAKRSAVHKPKHFEALDYRELPGFMVELRQREGVFDRALEFAILTAARTNEVLGATWAEIDLTERTWIIPADRMKSGREHRVALSARALAIIDGMAAIRSSDFVFPGRSGGQPAPMTLRRVLAAMDRGGLAVHGFRSTFRSWAAERTNFAREIAELALAHVAGDQVERAYQRSDLIAKRRQLMDAWAAFCEMPSQTGKVVPIRV